jgi:glycosyltransferase involved in cell wall biosynthesis
MIDYPQTKVFGSVSVILPVMTETTSLIQTVDVILRDCRPNVHEFLIIVCDRTKPESLRVAHSLQERLGSLVVIHKQRLPYLGGAMREAFDLARGTHVIMMASDLGH